MSAFFKDAVKLPQLPGYGVMAWSVAEPDEIADRIWVDVDYANGFRTQSCFGADEARDVARLLIAAADAVDEHNAERSKRLAMQDAQNDGFLDNADPDMERGWRRRLPRGGVAMSPESNHWFVDHANVVTLVNYMAERGDSALEVAHAVEQPWNYESDFRIAQAILDEKAAA